MSAASASTESKTLAEELASITKLSTEMVDQKFNAEEKTIYRGLFEQLQTSQINGRSKKVGDKAPQFELLDYVTGQKVSLSSLIASGPLVLFFYRGVWCPFCSTQIRHIQKSLSAFQIAYKGGAGKVNVAGVSLQIKSQVEKAKNDLGVTFPLLVDESFEVSSSFGLLWHVPDKYEQVVRAKFGGDLTKAQHNLPASAAADTAAKLLVNKISSAAIAEREGVQILLPAPATFVIDLKGIIRFAQVNPDYRQRAEPSDVINALKAL